MRLIAKVLLAVCFTIACAGTTEQISSRSKRQIGGTLGVGGKSIGGGIGQGFGQYDYNDYYGDYIGDYNYDYYDWVCTTNPPMCQLCNILGSECCDPAVDVNCFLPDSCLNNPCLSGGTCITVKTIDDRPDFTCVCLPGLSGKYCQLATDYFVGAQFFAPPPLPVVPSFLPGGAAPVPGFGAPPMGGLPPMGGPPPMGGAAPMAPAQQQYAAPAQAQQQYAAPAQQSRQPTGGPPPGGSIPYPHPGLGQANGLGRGPLTGPMSG